jgi:hypothetical protein
MNIRVALSCLQKWKRLKQMVQVRHSKQDRLGIYIKSKSHCPTGSSKQVCKWHRRERVPISNKLARSSVQVSYSMSVSVQLSSQGHLLSVSPAVPWAQRRGRLDIAADGTTTTTTTSRNRAITGPVTSLTTLETPIRWGCWS